MPCDEGGWWEEERALFIRRRVTELTSPGAIVTDIGCGRGRLLAHGSLGSRVVVNVDSHIWEEWSQGKGALYVCATADALPFRDGAFDLVGSFDVLEHLADDVAGLAEQNRVVCPAGHVVSAVPADQRLWSGHDVAVGHFRRYDIASFGALAQRAGLRIERATHFFSFLWPPAWLTRKRPARTEPGNSPGLMGGMVRRTVAVFAATERWVTRKWRLPFGTSLWVESRPDPDA